MSPSLPSAAVHGRVGVQDRPARQVRNPSDLLGVVGCALGIVLVCLMVIYAHNTTEGIAADVRAFIVLLQRILFIPVTILDLIVALFPPIAIGIDLLVRRYPRVALQGLIGGVGGVLLSLTAAFLARQSGLESLVTGLSVVRDGVGVVTIPAYIAGIMALLTSVATPASRRSITWSWNLLWIAVVVAVVTSAASLAGMAIALLVGRMVGYAVRYGLGVASQRAYGTALVDGIRRAGFEPVTIDRVQPDHEPTALPGTQVPQFFSDHRLYVMRTALGKIYNVIVLDGDRQVMSLLTRLWRYLRLRSIEGRATVLSLRQSAERTALLSYAIRSAGVSTPAVLAIAEAEASMLIVREATADSLPFSELDPGRITDGLLDAMWAQILKAHRCGVVHRALTPDCFRIEVGGPGQDQLWVLGWESGDIAASELARHIDLTQLLALIAGKVGPARALDSAGRALDPDVLASLGPLLQVPAVPKATRDQMSDPKEVLAGLRTELIHDLPDATTEPAQIARVGARTIIMAVLVTVVVIVVLTSLNLSQVVPALRGIRWEWAVAAFGISMLAFPGISMSLIAYSPIKLKFWRVCVTQVAAAFVAMAAPVGLGPAAVNLRMLTKKNVPTPVATATVALSQVTNIVVVVLSSVILTVATGSTSQLPALELSPGMLVAILVVVAVAATILIVPKTRAWVLSRVVPMLRQTGPRLVELISSPYRLALGVLGNLISIASYVVAMLWAVQAFGVGISVLAATMVYIIGTSAGSAIPTPGGVGAIEVTEAAILVSLGINPGIAASMVLLFRLVTYWIRIPIGFAAYRWLTKVGDL